MITNMNGKFYIPKKTLMVISIECQSVGQFVSTLPMFHSRAGNKQRTPWLQSSISHHCWLQKQKRPFNSQAFPLILYFSSNILLQHEEDACPLVLIFINQSWDSVIPTTSPGILTLNLYPYGWATSSKHFSKNTVPEHYFILPAYP